MPAVLTQLVEVFNEMALLHSSLSGGGSSIHVIILVRKAILADCVWDTACSVVAFA